MVFDAASATASTVAGTPYIGGFVPYQLRTLASQHCHEVKKEYCYMVPRVRDVDREVSCILYDDAKAKTKLAIYLISSISQCISSI